MRVENHCVRLYVEASVVLVSSSLVFFGKFFTENICNSAPYHITMKTQILGAQYSANIFRLFVSMSSFLKCNFKYTSEKYIKPISEKYIKSRLKT